MSEVNFIAKLTADAKKLTAGLDTREFERTAHNDILSLLKDQINHINYREIARLDDGEKLQRKHHSIITIEKLLETATLNQWGIATQNGFIYLYNGAYWQVIDKAGFMGFLGEVAQKMGVYEFDAKHHLFRDELYKQFLATANLPVPPINPSVTLINLLNGTFEITATEQRLREPDAKDFLKHRLDFKYDPTAKAPKFQAFLDVCLPDADCQKVLAEYVGYIFTHSLKLEKALILYGSGANGKSVFYEVVTALLGSENTCSYSLENLTKADSYQRAELSNKLVNYASEINGKLEASTFKQLVSGEPVEARQIYEAPFIMTNYAKLIFNCNELPREVEQTKAFFRRFLIIPFAVTIPENKQDKKLAQKIIDSELSGVFNWVLDGLARILTNEAFTDSDLIAQQLSDYEKESDSVKMFIEDEGYKPSNQWTKPLKEMYAAYRIYASDSGYKVVNIRNFGERLKNVGFSKEKSRVGQIVWCEK